MRKPYVCLTPQWLELPDGQSVLAACRHCWQCRLNRVNDYVGRCIAEQANSTKVLSVTLTYKGDGPNTAVLCYKDVQDFFKRLRKAGYKVRYLVTGEYGSERERTHWHVILFFSGRYPQFQRGIIDPKSGVERIQWSPWSDQIMNDGITKGGHIVSREVGYKGFRYVLKYILKEHTGEQKTNSPQVQQTHLAMSTKPVLGYQFIVDLARRYVENGISPQKPEYAFRDVVDNNGKRRLFWLQGRSREIFAAEFIRLWEAKHKKEYPFSDFLDRQTDMMFRRDHVRTEDEIERYVAGKKMEAERAPYKKLKPVDDRPGSLSMTLWALDIPGTKNSIIALGNGSFDITFEKAETWRVIDEHELRENLKALQATWGFNYQHLCRSLNRLLPVLTQSQPA